MWLSQHLLEGQIARRDDVVALAVAALETALLAMGVLPRNAGVLCRVSQGFDHLAEYQVRGTKAPFRPQCLHILR